MTLNWILIIVFISWLNKILNCKHLEMVLNKVERSQFVQIQA